MTDWLAGGYCFISVADLRDLISSRGAALRSQLSSFFSLRKFYYNFMQDAIDVNISHHAVHIQHRWRLKIKTKEDMCHYTFDLI